MCIDSVTGGANASSLFSVKAVNIINKLLPPPNYRKILIRSMDGVLLI